MYAENAGLPGGDCDDENIEIFQGAEDTWYDGVDSDCEENNDYDQDGDGYVDDMYGKCRSSLWRLMMKI